MGYWSCGPAPVLLRNDPPLLLQGLGALFSWAFPKGIGSKPLVTHPESPAPRPASFGAGQGLGGMSLAGLWLGTSPPAGHTKVFHTLPEGRWQAQGRRENVSKHSISGGSFGRYIFQNKCENI